jgi:hypothetical protein
VSCVVPGVGVVAFIEEYFVLSHVAALHSHIAASVSPVELTAIVAEFLTPASVAMGSLSVNDCLASRRRIAEQSLAERRVGFHGCDNRRGSPLVSPKEQLTQSCVVSQSDIRSLLSGRQPSPVPWWPDLVWLTRESSGGLLAACRSWLFWRVTAR